MSDLHASLDREFRASDRPFPAVVLRKRLHAGDAPFREAVEKALSDRVAWRWPLQRRSSSVTGSETFEPILFPARLCVSPQHSAIHCNTVSPHLPM